MHPQSPFPTFSGFCVPFKTFWKTVHACPDFRALFSAFCCYKSWLNMLMYPTYSWVWLVSVGCVCHSVLVPWDWRPEGPRTTCPGQAELCRLNIDLWGCCEVGSVFRRVNRGKGWGMPICQSCREEGNWWWTEEMCNGAGWGEGEVTVQIQDLQAEPALPTWDAALVVWKFKIRLCVLPVLLGHCSDFPEIQNWTAWGLPWAQLPVSLCPRIRDLSLFLLAFFGGKWFS